MIISTIIKINVYDHIYSAKLYKHSKNIRKLYLLLSLKTDKMTIPAL